MKDIDGNEVGVGDVVKVLTIDPTLLGSLSDEEKLIMSQWLGTTILLMR